MDDMTVIDHVAVLAAALRRPAPPQGQKRRGAEEALKSVIIQVNIETVADQPRRHAVEQRRRIKPPLEDTRTRASS